MADVYQIEFKVSATPIEKQQLADGSDYSYSVHSSIDQIISKSITKSFGATSTKVVRDTATISTTPIDLGTACAGISGSINSILIICTAVTGSGEWTVKFGTQTYGTGSFAAVGDMILITSVRDSAEQYTDAEIVFTKVGGTSIGIEVIVGLI